MKPPAINLRDLSRVRAAAATGEARQIRQDAHIRTTELAAIVGVTPTTLARWETGYRVPSAADSMRWCAALDRLREVVDARPAAGVPVVVHLPGGATQTVELVQATARAASGSVS
jgi:transcriptional regulator with XRE-family HTH domain